jgi:hypothetical protein
MEARKAMGIESEVLIYAVVVIVCGNVYVVFEFILKKQFLEEVLSEVITNNSAAQPDISLAFKYPDSVPFSRRGIIF